MKRLSLQAIRRGWSMSVRFGVFVPQGWKLDLVDIHDPVEQYEAMTRVAREADGIADFDSIWVYDHFHTVPRPTLETTFEAWTSTAGLLRHTSRINVWDVVTFNAHPHPPPPSTTPPPLAPLTHHPPFFCFPPPSLHPP